MLALHHYPGNASMIPHILLHELKAPFEVAFDTHALVLADLRNQLRHLPRFNWQGWAGAAGYLVNNDIEHEQALEWIDRSVQMDENGQNLGLKVRLLQQLDRDEEARQTLARALEVSNEAQTNALGYVFLFGGDADTAVTIFQKNVEDYPESWNVYDSLGEAYAAKGETARARELYLEAMDRAWRAKERLLEMDVPREAALYVLPNAKALRFHETGNLLYLAHKWVMRTCFNAQEEIYRASMDELEQVRAVHPRLVRHMGPPCVLRAGRITPTCTEGEHFCGTAVWRSFPDVERRI